MNSRRRMLLLVLTSLGSCVALLGIAEIGLRTVAPVHLVGIQSAYQYDDDLGYRLAPGVHRHRLTDHLQEVRTNRLGTVNFQEVFEGYQKIAFALGDSFTQGTGLPADASYPFQLDLLWNRDERGAYAKRVAVVNLGLAAFGGRQSLLSLERYARELGRPDYVLYLGSDNDWEDDVLIQSGYRHRHVVHGSPLWGDWVGPLLWLGESELVKRGKLAIAELRRARLTADVEGRREAPAVNQPVSVAEREWPVIEEIHRLTREWGAVLVVSWANAPGPSYSWLRERAAEAGIEFADWEPRVASVHEAIPELPFGNPHSGGHWRSWVNAEIARSFAEALRRQSGLEAAGWTPP